MGKGAFVQIKKYGGAGGKNHLRHNLREKTRRELQGEIKKFGDWDSFFKLYDVPKKRSKQKWDYLEVTAYPENQEQADAIRQYLMRVTNRPVAGVWHFDESKPHVHYDIPWRDELGYALRLPPTFVQVWRKDISHMVGREFIPKGQGRSKIPGRAWYQDEDYYRARAQQEQEMIEKAREGIKQVLKLYDFGITISYLNRKGGVVHRRDRVFLNKDGYIMSEFENGKVKPLNIRGLIFRCYTQNEEITFAPYRYAKVWKRGKKKEMELRVFVDDIPENMFPLLPPDTLLVQTSETEGKRKYQAHFKYTVELENRGYSPEELDSIAKQVFRRVVEYYKGDPGSKDPYHLRKVPGFVNNKYSTRPPEVKIVRPKEIGMNWDTARMDLEKMVSAVAGLKKIEEIEKTEKVEIPKQEIKLNWRDFYRIVAEETPQWQRVDLNNVDMKYAIYLAFHGLTEDEIKERIRKERPDIAQKKKGHVEDYLNRTLKKAIKRAEYAERIRKSPHAQKIVLGRNRYVYLTMENGYPEFDLLPVKNVLQDKNGVLIVEYEDYSTWKQDTGWFKKGKELVKLFYSNLDLLSELTNPRKMREEKEPSQTKELEMEDEEKEWEP